MPRWMRSPTGSVTERSHLRISPTPSLKRTRKLGAGWAHRGSMQGAAGKAETMNDASAMLRRAADGARRALLGTRKAQWGARERPDGEPLYFIFTIDTEISMGGAAHDPSLK